MLSTSLIVDSLWAIILMFYFLIIYLMHLEQYAQSHYLNKIVASSKINNEGFFKIALAIAILCF